MDTAAEIFLLLTNDAGGAESWGTQTGWALGAATIADLLVVGRITLDESKDPRVRVIDATPTGNAVLDKVLLRLVDKDGRKLSSLVQDRKLDPTEEVVRVLVDYGVVGVEPKRLLGLVGEKRPTLNPGPEQDIRHRLRTVLTGGRPSASDATLLAILQGLGVARKVLADESEPMSGREVKQRIEAACGEVAVGAAIKRAVEAMNAAIFTAVIIPAALTPGS